MVHNAIRSLSGPQLANALRRDADWLRRFEARKVAIPWHMPRAFYYLTPWSWMRAYGRFGDWVLWHLWCASRPVMWWLEDKAIELDEAITEEARKALK